MKRRLEVAFSAFLVVVFAWAAWEATRWPEKAALFPLAIAIPATVLALVQLGVTARGASSPPRETGVGGDLPERERGRRALEAVGWILGFVAAALALGFFAAVPLASFLYLRRAGEGWAASVLIPAGLWAFLYVVFDRALHVPLPPGPLLALLGLR